MTSLMIFTLIKIILFGSLGGWGDYCTDPSETFCFIFISLPSPLVLDFYRMTSVDMEQRELLVASSTRRTLAPYTQTRRLSDISDLQRRLAYLSSAIDETLQRPSKAASSLPPADTRSELRCFETLDGVPVIDAAAAVHNPAEATRVDSSHAQTTVVKVKSRSAIETRGKRSAATSVSLHESPVRQSRLDSTATHRSRVSGARVVTSVSRHDSAASSTALASVPVASEVFSLKGFSGHRAQLHEEIASSVASSVLRSAQDNQEVRPRPDAHPGRVSSIPVSAPSTTHRSKKRLMSPPPPVATAAAVQHGASPRDASSREEGSVADLKREEESIKLRIEVLKRLEHERRELLEHQRRMLELDNERLRLNAARSLSSSPRAGSSHRRGQSLGSGEALDGSDAQQVFAEKDAAHPSRRAEAAPTVSHPRAPSTSSTVLDSGASQQRGANPRLLETGSVYTSTSRSVSPLAVRPSQFASPLRVHSDPNALAGGARKTAIYPPSGVEDEDARLRCRAVLASSDGIVGKVLTGRDSFIECRFHLANNSGRDEDDELIAVPTASFATAPQLPDHVESHHFPLRCATLMYPNGIVQHRWPPKRMHVRGVVVGNKAKSVLLAKGCPYYTDMSESSRYRMYLTVGSDPYDDASTLLVMQFPDRRSWLCMLLGLHGTMWPQGKPPLNSGRSLWLLACHVVTQQYWSANRFEDTVFHMTRRRSRSQQPSVERHAAGSSSVPIAAASPALVISCETPLAQQRCSSSRFSVPPSPVPAPRFTVATGGAPPPSAAQQQQAAAMSKPQQNSQAAHRDATAPFGIASRNRHSAPGSVAMEQVDAVGPGSQQPNLVSTEGNWRTSAKAGTRAVAPPLPSGNASGASVPKTFFPRTAAPQQAAVQRSSASAAMFQYGY